MSDPEARTVMPLFPLGMVLFPGLLLPLNIFEPRYRALIEHLQQLDPERRGFGVIAIREGREVGADGVRALHAIGCVAQLQQVDRQPDGRYEVLTVGGRRFQLHQILNDPANGTEDGGVPFLVGEVSLLPEISEDPASVLARSALARFDDYRTGIAAMQDLEVDVLEDLPDDPTVISYLVASAMVLDLADRQALLEIRDTVTRLRVELDLLRREIALAELLPSLPAGEFARNPVSLN